MAERVIRSIGLALSGGGYRAAGFHLGAMDMLARLQLLDRVKGLSTVSGGTIAGAYYALQQSRGKKPEEIIPELARWLVENDVIARALSEHRARTRGTESRRWNLITNASEVYNELLGGAQFGELFDNSGHLDDLIFNATEFQTGMDFRFQKTIDPNAKVGNGQVYMTQEAARQLRLGDIVAASSCFPGGFEPLELPADFVFPGAEPEMRHLPKHLAVMDGGIYDNQGTEALLLQRQEREAFDVVLVSDTDQRPKSAYYSMPVERYGWRGLEVGTIVTMIALLGAITVGGAVNNVITLLHYATEPWWEIALDVLPSVVAGVFFIGLYVIWKLVKARIVKSYPNLAGGRLRRFLFSLRWADLKDLIELRLGSLLAMTSSVFLKRIRQLGYMRLEDDPKISKKLVTNLIYGMATKKGKAELPPTKAQVELAERANLMPTTLWFDDEKQFRDVFACGQNTVVHALLRWMERRAKAGEGDAEGGEVTNRLREMWKLLQEDPFRFVPSVKAAKSGRRSGEVSKIPDGAQVDGVKPAQPTRETA